MNVFSAFAVSLFSIGGSVQEFSCKCRTAQRLNYSTSGQVGIEANQCSSHEVTCASAAFSSWVCSWTSGATHEAGNLLWKATSCCCYEENHAAMPHLLLETYHLRIVQLDYVWCTIVLPKANELHVKHTFYGETAETSSICEQSTQSFKPQDLMPTCCVFSLDIFRR